MEFNIVRSARAALRLSQDELAGLLGVSKNTIYNWEKGKTAPSQATIDQIHKITVELEDARTGELSGGPDLCLVVAKHGFFRAPYGRVPPLELIRESYPARGAALNRAYWLYRSGLLGHAFIVGKSENIILDHDALVAHAEDVSNVWCVAAADDRPIPMDDRQTWRVTFPNLPDAMLYVKELVGMGYILKMSTPDAVLDHGEILTALASR